MLLIITPLMAAALVVIYVRLTLDVINIRRRDRVSLGDAGNDDLLKAMRAQANLTEWAPIAIILVGVLEINAAPIWLCALPAITFLAGRVLHPQGIVSSKKENFKKRVLGMQLTIYSVMALAALNILWLLYQFMLG